MRYTIGEKVRLLATYSDPQTGTLLDPAAVYVSWKDPDGNITQKQHGTDPELVKDAVGTYHIDIDASAAGQWTYRWWSTGTGQAAGEGAFAVAPSAVA